jgi:two-component system OmpR family sensor kinase
MLFDDRLATVLRSRADGEQAARTQFRQLLDLLGSSPDGWSGQQEAEAYARLAEIEQVLPAEVRAGIVRESWLRLRNPRLIGHLAEGEPQPAAAAIAAARLDEEQWLELIPGLTVTGRGLLRHRRDLPDSVRRLLARLGVGDLVLPQPDGAAATLVETRAPPPGEGIADLLRRIETFRRARHGEAMPLAPRLPLEDDGGGAGPGGGRCDFSTDALGRIDWADAGYAPLLVGLPLQAEGRVDAALLIAMRDHQPVWGGRLAVEGTPAVAGQWRLDAAPRFSPAGAFAGYAGRLRRQSAGRAPGRAPSGAGDRMRQVLHELRTPVGAIQGFAEVIQQQVFGPAPNAYRALAAAVGVDAARLLAGFDEIERMARLESGALAVAEGTCNLRLVVEATLQRLDGVLRPRSSKMRLLVSGESFALGVAEEDAALLAWRLLATLGGALAPGEVIELTLRGEGGRVMLGAELPVGLGAGEDPFAAVAPAQAPVVTAGMFGTGFTLRLARAEARALGGNLSADEESLVLDLPALTAAGASHSHGGGDRENPGPA